MKIRENFSIGGTTNINMNVNNQRSLEQSLDVTTTQTTNCVTNFVNKITNNIKINIDKKIDFLNNNSFETLISSKFNGVIFRTSKFGFYIYINLIYK